VPPSLQPQSPSCPPFHALGVYATPAEASTGPGCPAVGPPSSRPLPGAPEPLYCEVLAWMWDDAGTSLSSAFWRIFVLRAAVPWWVLRDVCMCVCGCGCVGGRRVIVCDARCTCVDVGSAMRVWGIDSGVR
jgi:hypothetical protein